MNTPMDEVYLNFSPDSLWLLNICLGLIMFGVSLDLKLSEFKNLAKAPKGVWLGLVSQFLLLPALTYILVYFWNPSPSMALGMILVAACPGGNVSNFISSLSGGSLALSVSLTMLATMLSPFLTPLNFTLWGQGFFPAQHIMKEIDVTYLQLAETVLVLLVIPMILGMLFSYRFPKLTLFIKKPIRVISLVIFAAFVVIAFSKNVDLFLAFIAAIFILVMFHNLMAYFGGWLVGWLGKLPVNEKKSIIVETGIQNSGLALVIIFNFFDGLGGMALIAAWWGIWHILAGLGIASVMRLWKN